MKASLPNRRSNARQNGRGDFGRGDAMAVSFSEAIFWAVFPDSQRQSVAAEVADGMRRGFAGIPFAFGPVESLNK